MMAMPTATVCQQDRCRPGPDLALGCLNAGPDRLLVVRRAAVFGKAGVQRLKRFCHPSETMNLAPALLTFLIASTGVGSTSAKEQQACPLESKNANACVCKSGLAGEQVRSFRGLRLAAICGHQRHEGLGEDGEFFFNGRERIKGRLTYQSVESLGEGYFFYSTDLPWYLHGIRFDHDAEVEAYAKRSFRAPALEASVQCWQADAVLDLRSLHLKLAGGTDADGPFATRFRLVQRSKFAAC